MQLKIGELARRSGLTVRTLHHYDAIGLLSPSGRSEGGYRLYSRKDVARLHQIQAIKQLGFSLVDVREMLSGNKVDAVGLIRQQRLLLDRQLEHAGRLRDCLLLLEEQIEAGHEPTLADWLSTLELMSLHSKYFSTEEIQAMRARKQREAELSEAGWRQLFAKAGDLMQAGVPPTDSQAYGVAIDWMERAKRLAGGDALMMQRLGEMHRSEPTLQERSGSSPEMLDYLKRAFIHGSFAIFEKYLTGTELATIRANIFDAFDDWPMLVIRMRQEFVKGTSPQDSVVRQLATEWKALFRATYGNGDPLLEKKMAAALEKEAAWGASRGVDAALLAFLFPEKALSNDKNFQRAKVKK